MEIRNAERKIVHIKDVFGGGRSEEEKENVVKIFPNAGPADTNINESVDDDGYISPRYIKAKSPRPNSRVESKFIKASNQSDVFFGAPPGDRGSSEISWRESRSFDTRSSPGTAASRTKKKRPAPLPPPAEYGGAAPVVSPSYRPPSPHLLEARLSSQSPSNNTNKRADILRNNPNASRPLPAIPGQQGVGGNVNTKYPREVIQPTSGSSSSGVETDDSHSTNNSLLDPVDVLSGGDETKLAQYKVMMLFKAVEKCCVCYKAWW
jgi:hypothetical protein